MYLVGNCNVDGRARLTHQRATPGKIVLSERAQRVIGNTLNDHCWSLQKLYFSRHTLCVATSQIFSHILLHKVAFMLKVPVILHSDWSSTKVGEGEGSVGSLDDSWIS